MRPTRPVAARRARQRARTLPGERRARRDRSCATGAVPGRPRWAGDEGSAIVEFCVLSVLMLVPLVYLVAVLGRVQAASMAAQAGAREAGRAFVTARADADAQQRAGQAAELAFLDQGFTGSGLTTVNVSCGSDPCLTPDAQVEVRTRVVVVLPGVPRVLDRAIPAHLEVTARQVVVVDRFRAVDPVSKQKGDR